VVQIILNAIDIYEDTALMIVPALGASEHVYVSPSLIQQDLNTRTAKKKSALYDRILSTEGGSFRGLKI